MGLLYVIMDGIEYKLPIEYPSLSRSFSFLEGGQGGVMQSGAEVLDTIGTNIGYSLHIPAKHRNPAGYDAFFEAISSSNREHVVTLPYGQTSMTFYAKVEAGADVLQGAFGDSRLWGNLTVKFTPTRPQR